MHAILHKIILIQFITIVKIFHGHITIFFKDKHHITTGMRLPVENWFGGETHLRPHQTALYNPSETFRRARQRDFSLPWSPLALKNIIQ